MHYVIRSMSTTDYVPASRGVPASKPVPYHIYLMRPERRASAWWTSCKLDAMDFATEELAQAELKRLQDANPFFGGEVASSDADALGKPTYWDNLRRQRG